MTPYKPGLVVLSRAEWKDLMRRMREEERRQRRLVLAARLKERREALRAARS